MSDNEKGKAWDFPILQESQKESLDFIITGRLQLDMTWSRTLGEGCSNLLCHISKDTGFIVKPLFTVKTVERHSGKQQELSTQTDSKELQGEYESGLTSVAPRLIFGNSI